MYRRNITDDTNIINNSERNLLQENLNEKHIRTTDQVDYIRSDHLIDESTSTTNIESTDIRTRKDVRLQLQLLTQFVD